MPNLAGRRVLITAAARGIGRATARAFRDSGAAVHICDLDASALDEAGRADPDLTTTLADVCQPDEVARLFDDALSALGGIDVLVNNAGIAGPTAPVEEIALEDWRRTLAVNLDAVFLCARKAASLMKAQGGGVIINLSSTAGLHGFARRSPYCAAKWAVIGFTKTLAMELGPYGVRANAVCPGAVAGPRMEQVMAEHSRTTGRSVEEIRGDYMADASLRTFIDPEDIADMIVFLSSPAAARVTGQAVSVDGHLESFASR